MGGPGAGGPGGGGDRASRLEGFLRSMDANGDGVIHESEVPEERRRMFRFMADRAGLDPAQGVPIAKIVEGMANRGGGGPPRGDGGDQPATEAASGQPAPTSRDATEQRTAPAEPPLVPGFGVERSSQPVPGFGTRIQPPSRMILGGASAATTDRRSGQRRETEQDGRSAPAEETARESSGARQRGSYRFRAPHERLPEGLPDWFLERDVNMDGQVSMWEFADEWTDEKVHKFFQYDGNNDGVITVEEALHPPDEPAATAAERYQSSTMEPARSQTADSGQKPAGSEQKPADSEPTPADSGTARPWWLEP